MSTVNIDLAADTILNVMIGQQDENEVREVVFDFSGWYTTYGSGTISLAIQRPKDEWTYEGTLTVDSTNHKATWDISETDTAYAGTGQIQLSYKVGDAKKKSVVYRFTCHKSLGALGSVVTPVQIQTFIDEVEEALQTMDGKLDDMEDEIADVKSDLANLSGLSNETKDALLACFSKVAWIDDDGQDYYDALESALYPPVELTSISCVYTQSGTVYTTDSLNSLKDNLVVTAHYEDSTSATVTTYTLSGTLTEGTSTITVSYGGKTTTFDVTVTEAPLVPTGYTQYDYISNITNLQDNINYYIDTGVSSSYCDTKYIHEIDFYVPSGLFNGNHGLYGCRNQSGSAGAANGNSIWFNGTQNKVAVGYNGVDSGYTLSCNWASRHKIKLDNGKVYIDDTLVSEPSGDRTSYSSSSICLFSVKTNSSTGGVVRTVGYKIYSVVITDSDTNEVVARLVPCTDPDGKAGVYETVSGTFHYATNYSYYSCGNEAE